MEQYQPIFMNDFAPQDRYHQQHRIDNLQVQFPVMLYKYSHRTNIARYNVLRLEGV